MYINCSTVCPFSQIRSYSAVKYICTFLVPISDVDVTAPDAQIVGQSLTLECSITTVRGITSRVDIVWSSDDGLQLKRTEGVSVNYSMNNLVVYTDRYSISQLSTDDENRAYQCEVVINSDPLSSASGNVTLNVTGKP